VATTQWEEEEEGEEEEGGGEEEEEGGEEEEEEEEEEEDAGPLESRARNMVDRKHKVKYWFSELWPQPDEHLCQQNKYAEGKTAVNEVWTTDALTQVSKEDDNTWLTNLILASALSCESTKEKYENAKVIVKKVWQKMKSYVSLEASPSTESIGWRLAWTYQLLEDYVGLRRSSNQSGRPERTILDLVSPRHSLHSTNLLILNFLQSVWKRLQARFSTYGTREKTGQKASPSSKTQSLGYEPAASWVCVCRSKKVIRWL
jgi:hypothetical protein